MSYSVLIIDDDTAIRQCLEDSLEIQGYVTCSAANGREAIECLTKMEQKPGLIILDIMMPVMNGWQFLEYVKNHPEYNQIPVVVCSAFTESAKSFKNTRFIGKPLELPHLLETVKSYCA